MPVNETDGAEEKKIIKEKRRERPGAGRQTQAAGRSSTHGKLGIIA